MLRITIHSPLNDWYFILTPHNSDFKEKDFITLDVKSTPISLLPSPNTSVVERSQKNPNQINFPPPKITKSAFPAVYKKEDTTFEEFKKKIQDKSANTNVSYSEQIKKELKMDNQESNQPFMKWRFDLDGKYLASNLQNNLPTYLGLHHHGEESDKAGYTISEIFHLIRSSIPSQVVINLKIVSNLVTSLKDSTFQPIADTKQGLCPEQENKNYVFLSFEMKFLNLVSTVKYLLEYISSKIPLVLRVLLDSPHQTVIISAFNCLHALLVSSQEITWMEVTEWQNWMMFCIDNANFLNVMSLSVSGTKNQSEEETFEDIIRRDIVDAFIQMEILGKLRLSFSIFFWLCIFKCTFLSITK